MLYIFCRQNIATGNIVKAVLNITRCTAHVVFNR